MRTAPAGTVNGVLRLTEQGEVINQSYGLRPIAMRTLERAFNALCVVARRRGARASPRRSEQVQFAARVGLGEPPALPALRARGRGVLRVVPGGDAHRRDHAHADRFAPGGAPRQGRLRGAARRAVGVRVDAVAPHAAGLVSARAWGCKTAIDELGLDDRAFGLRANGRSSPRSSTTSRASLARADLEIAAAYEELAEARPPAFRAPSCARNSSWCASRCWQSSRRTALLDRDPTLQRSIELRNPYVDPINLLQVDLLRRWRETGRQDRDLFEALLACIAGIAEGLQSTG